MNRISGWGRYPVVRAEERVSEDLVAATEGASLTRGLGRSYGDASLPARDGAPVACSRLADRLLGFDDSTGRLRAEAGFSLERLNRVFIERGWSSPVMPGTRFVTLGGMAAADVHGKNHHVAGTFGAHVRSLKMRVADGTILEASETDETELFHATLGGMGLTGHILEVELALRSVPSPWIYQEVEAADDLPSLISTLRAAGEHWPFTVCWADCVAPGRSFGRGLLIKGRWAAPHEVPQQAPGRGLTVTVPFDLPGWALNRPLGRVFNQLYRAWNGLRRGPRIVSPDAFFHPLDGLLHWNRLYGVDGFTQYQCVLPEHAGEPAVRALFEQLEACGGGSYLTVIKDCGPEGRGMLSFPMPGISVALDLPMVAGWTRSVVDALNDVVVEAGGRVYLAKDALTRSDHFRAMEPRLEAWDAVRRKWDPDRTIDSAQSRRLFGGDG